MQNNDLDARFLSTLSHDLRGGLHSVQLAMDMLRGDVLESVPMEQLLGDVEFARRSLVETGARAERIVCARRIHRGTMPVRFGEADIVPAVQAAIRFTALAEEDAVNRVVLEAPERVVVRSDGRLVSELLGGLLDHALRTVVGGKIRVVLDAGGLLEVAVDKPWITNELNAVLAVATNDPPFGEPTLGLYVAAGVARLINTQLRVTSDRAVQVALAVQAAGTPAEC